MENGNSVFSYLFVFEFLLLSVCLSLSLCVCLSLCLSLSLLFWMENDNQKVLSLICNVYNIVTNKASD